MDSRESDSYFSTQAIVDRLMDEGLTFQDAGIVAAKLHRTNGSVADLAEMKKAAMSDMHGNGSASDRQIAKLTSLEVARYFAHLQGNEPDAPHRPIIGLQGGGADDFTEAYSETDQLESEVADRPERPKAELPPKWIAEHHQERMAEAASKYQSPDWLKPNVNEYPETRTRKPSGFGSSSPGKWERPTRPIKVNRA